MERATMNLQSGGCPAHVGRLGGPRSVRGQSITEFVIVIPILLLLILGTLQFAMLYVAKSTLNQAAMTGARKGAVNHASTCAIQEGVIKGLTPLYESFDPNSTTTGNSATYYDTVHKDAEDAIKQAPSGNINSVAITILNPSGASFTDFGHSVNGHVEIPSSRLLYRNQDAGRASGQSIQDANLLKIRVEYCYKLIVPYVSVVLKQLHMTGSLFDTGCYKNGGAPIESDATVLMQSPAWQNYATCP